MLIQFLNGTSTQLGYTVPFKLEENIELHIKPITKSFRQMGNSIPGKVRPLKVTVCTATSVIGDARYLMKSNDEYVQRNVYSNTVPTVEQTQER